MALYVTDTHPLLWYTTGRHVKLSKEALRIFRDAEAGGALIFVPAVALWEVSVLIRAGRFALARPFAEWAETFLTQVGFELAPLDPIVIAETLQFHLNGDPFDVAIVATARLKDLPLITKDEKIFRSGLIDVAW
jgi:PIN domain nuclease of toxin-antitoxin system